MIQYLYPAISGVMVTLSFPKPDLGFLAWIALVPYFIQLFKCNDAKEAARCGAVFGCVYFLGVLAWLTSLSRWVGLFGYVAWILLSLAHALAIALFSVLAFIILKRYSREVSFLAVPYLWAFIEWFRTLGELGSPAGILGYTQYQMTPVIQIARHVHVFGVSFLIVLVNYFIAELMSSDLNFKEKLKKFKPQATFVFIFMLAVLLYGAYKLSDEKPLSGARGIRIGVIQPNFDQSMKLNARNSFYMLDVLSDMTNGFRGQDIDVIIWPETAVMNVPERVPGVMDKLKKTAADANAFLITGAYTYRNGELYNSVLSISPSGEIVSRYSKEHLMPFGEYLPFKPLSKFLLASTGFFDFDQTPDTDPKLFNAGRLNIGMMICFESLFGGLAEQRSKGADILLTVTNDSWFGASAGAYQHIMAAPFRAIENRKYFIQAANTGISAVVDPMGRFRIKTVLGAVQVFSADVLPGSASR